MNQLYALLRDDQIRYIDLADEIVESTRELFVNAAAELMEGVTEEVEFNGNYVIREDEDEISYVFPFILCVLHLFFVPLHHQNIIYLIN